MKTLYCWDSSSRAPAFGAAGRLGLVLFAGVLALVGPGAALAQRPLGIDVSSYQGSISWSSVKGDGVVFAWAKATEGQTVNDGYFTGNIKNGKAAGVYMGAYHFAHPELHSPGTEASHFWSIAGAYIKADGKTLMPMLDMEVFSGVVGASSYSDWANQWCNDIVNYAKAANVKVKPVIYVSACSACHFNSSVAQWLNDIADYNGENLYTGTPWSVCNSCAVWGSGVWNFWQGSSSGRISGISGNVDLDTFHGTTSGLISTAIATSTAVNDSSVASSSVPGTVNSGASFTATVTMKNTGTLAWSSSGSNPYRLGSQSPQDNTTWGLSRVNLPSSPINPGSSAKFTIQATAPTGLGSHTFAWKMVHENVEWFGATFSTTINVVAVPPSITTQPSNLTKNPGQTATFTVAASGTAPLSYKWRKNGVNLANDGNIAGATSSALSISNVQLADAANYDVVVSNAGGTATSSQAALTVTATPYPAGTGVGLQGKYFNNTSLAGSSSLTRTDAVVNFNWSASSPSPGIINTNDFSVRWSGQVQPLYNQIYTFYTTTDDGARLWVNGVLLIDKWVNQSATEWSGTISLVAGQKYNLQMDYYENTGSATAQLSWSSASQAKQIIPQTQLYPTQPSGQLGPIPGIFDTGVGDNRALLAAGAVDPHYRLIASPDSSAPGPNSLVANEGYPIPPWLTNGPNSKWIAPRAAENVGNVPGNYTYRLTFDLTDLDPNAAVISGNWAVDNSGVDILLNGVSTHLGNANGWVLFSAFQITNGFSGGTNTLDFVINNSGSVTNPTGLRVELSGVTGQAFPPTIVGPPQSLVLNEGASATFTVVASGTAPLSYQWQFNGDDITGATRTSYTRANVQPEDAGSYSVIVSNAFSTAASADAVLVVNEPPTITTQPQDQQVNLGGSAAFSVAASGADPLSFQWRRNGVNLAGATGTSYARNNVQTADQGSYSVVVTNMAGSATSSDALLTVVVAPAITTQPQNQTVAQGANASFVVAATGTAPLTYQWLFNGEEIADGTDSSYTRTSAQFADQGLYSVAVLNAAGVAVSSNATLTVNAPPAITRQPGGLTVYPGATVSFSVQAAGSLPFTYQWRLNGTNIAGATGASFTRTNVMAADFGPYSVVVSNAFGFSPSEDAPLSPSDLTARVEWTTIDGGGGMSAGGGWTFSGTIGQPDAGRLAQGVWTMEGGFWNGLVGKPLPVAGPAFFTRAANASLSIPVSSLLTNASDPDGDILSLFSVSATSTNGAGVAISSGSVVYSPAPPDANLPDQFTYTVVDPFGNQASGPVFISVSGSVSNPPPTISGFHLLVDGRAQLDLLGTANQWYTLQTTTNLAPPAAWVNLSTNQADGGGVLHYIDSAATNYPTRFYRFAAP